MMLGNFGFYRAGWPGRGTKRSGRWWVWIGPYAVGYLRDF